MADRRKFDALQQLHALRLAQKSAAEAELLAAAGAERTAEAERDRSDEAVGAAAAQWEAQLTQRFDPGLSRLYALALAKSVEVGKRAAATLDQAREDSLRCGDALQELDALNRHAETLATRAGRQWRRHREERALHAQADRTAFHWSKR